VPSPLSVFLHPEATLVGEGPAFLEITHAAL
jgi:hypothetical protein